MKYRWFKILYLLLFALLIVFRMLFEGGDSPGGIWNIFQGIFVLSGVILLCKNGRSILRLPPAKTFVGFSFYIWILSLPALGNFSISSLFYFIVIPFAAMSMAVFYYYNSKTDTKDGAFIIVAAFYAFAFLFFLERRASFFYDISAMTANAYYVICLLPVALLFHPKKLSFVPFVVTFIVVIFSGKRTGILALALMLTTYYYDSTQSVLKKIGSLLGFGIIAVAAYYVYSYFRVQYNIDVLSRIENLSEDGGSGRDRIWLTILVDFVHSHPIEMLFGHGHGSVAALRGGQAHNDFIQVLYEYGIFALLAYIYFYYKLFTTWIRMKRMQYPNAKHFVLTLIVALFMANFSFFIVEPRIILCCSLCWGLLLSDWWKYRNELNESSEI